MRPIFSLAGLLTITALVAGAAYAGDYYKWTDAHGTVHYSQTPPPPDRASTTVHVSDGAPVAPLPGIANAPATPEEKARAQSSQTALDRANKQTLGADCAIAQKNIANLQGHGMVVASGDPDKARALESEQRAQALADARKDAATYCTHQP
ncbi:MAG: DUF4124 domain-containing protein [Rhodanobacteraceae bacterium]